MSWQMHVLLKLPVGLYRFYTVFIMYLINTTAKRLLRSILDGVSVRTGTYLCSSIVIYRTIILPHSRHYKYPRIKQYWYNVHVQVNFLVFRTERILFSAKYLCFRLFCLCLPVCFFIFYSREIKTTAENYNFNTTIPSLLLTFFKLLPKIYFHI